MSLGWCWQEQRPLLTQEILGGHVQQVDVTVGEDDEAGEVQTRPVRGEGAGGEVVTPGGCLGQPRHLVRVSEICWSPPGAPAVNKENGFNWLK